MKKTLLLKLECLKGAKAAPRFQERLRALEARYRSGLHVPPIPISMSVHGTLSLDRDGNHRLAAARSAGVETVRVRIIVGMEAQLRKRYGAT